MYLYKWIREDSSEWLTSNIKWETKYDGNSWKNQISPVRKTECIKELNRKTNYWESLKHFLRKLKSKLTK